MRRNLIGYALGVVFVLALPLLAFVSLTFTHIDRPGVRNTLPSGINANGVIVGASETQAQSDAGSEEGFLLSGKKYETIFYPGSFDTNPGAINKWGLVFRHFCG